MFGLNNIVVKIDKSLLAVFLCYRRRTASRQREESRTSTNNNTQPCMHPHTHGQAKGITVQV